MTLLYPCVVRGVVSPCLVNRKRATKSAFQRKGSRVDKFPPTKQVRRRLSPQTEEGDGPKSAAVVLRAGNQHVAFRRRHQTVNGPWPVQPVCCDYSTKKVIFWESRSTPASVRIFCNSGLLIASCIFSMESISIT